MDHVVVDVEIARTVEETPGGWDATDKLGVAVACVYEYDGGRIRVYGPNDVHRLRDRLLDADRITGYNIWNFDFPVIWGIPKPDWLAGRFEAMAAREALGGKTDDLLRRIWRAVGVDPDNFKARTHGGFSLEAVATATLGRGKIGNGADAPKWFQAGDIQRVVNYCNDDVCLERDLSDFIDRYGYVLAAEGPVRLIPWEATREAR